MFHGKYWSIFVGNKTRGTTSYGILEIHFFVITVFSQIEDKPEYKMSPQ